MWKQLTALLKRLDIRPRRGRDASRTLAARERFWSQVHEGQQEAEKASPPRALAPTIEN